MNDSNGNIKYIALNCNGYKSNASYVDTLTQSYDCIFLSELWITEAEIHLLHNFRYNFHVFFSPAKQGQNLQENHPPIKCQISYCLMNILR